MSLTRIAGLITALGVILGAAYAIDGRWVRCPVYAGDMSAVKLQMLRHEERSTQKEIYDVEDRLANPRLPEKRRGVYEQRLRALKQDLKEIEEGKAATMKKGGP